MQYFVGVDVSKAKLDVAMLVGEAKFRSKVFPNDPGGFVALLQWLQAHSCCMLDNVHVCMESTGGYQEDLACTLSDHAVAVSVVNPLVVKRFAEVNGQRNKTDEADAKTLALFCRMQRPERWAAPTPAVRRLQALVARLQTLQAMRQAESNRLELAHESVACSVRSVIVGLDEEIERLREQIRRTIDDDPDLKGRAGLLQTIPGLGDKTIPQLLACVGDPRRFRSAKALAAYASLTPLIRQSGTSLDRRRGTHPMGNRDLKRALYFPAMVAARYNPLIASFYGRLKAQHKPGKVIVVACMHKLLAIVYGVLRSGQPFNAHHQNLIET
jgi:transposase